MSAVVLRQESTTNKNSRQKIRQIVFPNFLRQISKIGFYFDEFIFQFFGVVFFHAQAITQ